MTVGEYRYRKNINDRDGNAIGCKESSVPNDIVKQIRADAIEEYKKALQEVIDTEGCVHGIDLKIEADKLIDGF